MSTANRQPRWTWGAAIAPEYVYAVSTSEPPRLSTPDGSRWLVQPDLLLGMRNFVMWQKHGDALLADDVQVGDHAAPAASEYLAVYEQMMGLMPGTVRASSSHEREWDSALAEAHRLYDARCDADDEGEYDERDDHWVPERLLDPFLVESQYEYAVVQS